MAFSESFPSHNLMGNKVMDPQLYGQLVFGKAGKNIHWKKDNPLNKRCWENCIFMQKNETEPLTSTKHKNKFKIN